MARSDLDVYVDHAAHFASARSYLLRRALDALRPAGCRYEVLDRAAPGRGGRCAFVHVDLTVVPDRHRPPPGAYALCLNGEATDISRLRYSTARIGRDSGWRGPVIVKSVSNHRGLPEFDHRCRTDALFRWRRRLMRRLGLDPRARACPPYALYPRPEDVPENAWGDPGRLVERFLPGVLRPPVVKHRFDFFLDVELRTRAVFDSLLCDARTVREVSVVGPVPEAVARVRRVLGLEFGAIDYFVVDGEAVVVDANKTTTADDDWIEAFAPVRRHVEAVGARLAEVVRAGSLEPGRDPAADPAG